MPLFLLELEVRPELEPANGFAVVESATHSSAPDEARERWSDIDDLVFVLEIPKDRENLVPTHLVGKRIDETTAQKVMSDCGIAQDDRWLNMPPMSLEDFFGALHLPRAVLQHPCFQVAFDSLEDVAHRLFSPKSVH